MLHEGDFRSPARRGHYIYILIDKKNSETRESRCRNNPIKKLKQKVWENKEDFFVQCRRNSFWEVVDKPPPPRPLIVIGNVSSFIIFTNTAEPWDGISRKKRFKQYSRDVSSAFSAHIRFSSYSLARFEFPKFSNIHSEQLWVPPEQQAFNFKMIQNTYGSISKKPRLLDSKKASFWIFGSSTQRV